MLLSGYLHTISTEYRPLITEYISEGKLSDILKNQIEFQFDIQEWRQLKADSKAVFMEGYWVYNGILTSNAL